MDDYCRCCAKAGSEVRLPAKTLADPESGRTCRVPICGDCEDKARRGERETWQKLKPFLPKPPD